MAEKSVTPDYIICLEDGVRLKTLKRYSARKYHLTPEQYRAKCSPPGWLSHGAPNYAIRSALAKEMGLGRTRKKRPPRTLPPAGLTPKGVSGRFSREPGQ